MRPLVNLGVLLIFLGSPLPAIAQEIRTLDLATAAQHDTVRVKPGRYQFSVTSLVPKYDYVIAISQGVETVPPISTVVSMAVVCPQLSAVNSALDKATKEGDIPNLVKQGEDALRAERSKDECKEHASTANQLLARTERTVDDVFTLAAGDYVILDVARIENKTATRRWQRRYTTGAPGEWRVMYGYVFPAFVRFSRGRVVKEGQRHFSKRIGDTGSLYRVTAEQRTRQFDAVPAVMFAYQPADEGSWTHHLFTAGLGVDLTKPVVFLGTGFTYRSNLLLAIGAAFRQEEVLNGQYKVGDTIRTNLTADQLQRDEFRLRPFVSVTLRFDKNPFKKEADAGSGEQKPGEKKPADKGDTTATTKPDMPPAKPPENPNKPLLESGAAAHEGPDELNLLPPHSGRDDPRPSSRQRLR